MLRWGYLGLTMWWCRLVMVGWQVRLERTTLKGFNCHIINWIFLTNEEQEKFVLFEKQFPEQTERSGGKHLIRGDRVEEGEE